MTQLAIIGGSGLTALPGLTITGQQVFKTPYGEPSGFLTFGTYAGHELLFLPRHGNPHTIPPHKVNYRANIWALQANNITDIIAVNAVGGVTDEMYPGRLVIPDQIIDYTWGRGHTFFEDGLAHVTHIDFTQPYSEPLRRLLIQAGDQAELPIYAAGTYGATQGPRLESTAEIDRLMRDGCDLVGMTGMPEAALAREMDINYASVCVVANWGAGRGSEAITMESIRLTLDSGMQNVVQLLEAAIPLLEHDN
ncbi:5'-deoxy-5'-methylthioadenosine phosphorylase [Methylohalomonas lacus]|uniref:Purine nucleoside phosphorylase n=1 Tax=Methylohalomonas lacus TaxID=398773 RepID=A0AAE3HJK2_9GAMM|nr:S-methyl-5'-thioinosine phosphorylase [Methylohalomonas lacus]MCS3902296.1 5'-deoxy-5'-methylthioadenosine phosphorylase [Methylohalomonas lacus]